jgi:hypothetical protein
MRYLLLLSNLCFAVIQASAAIDLTPTVTEYEGEGIRYRKVTFKSGDTPVSMALPFGWTCQGTSTRLKLSAPGSAPGEGVIEADAIKAGQVLDAAAFEVFKQKAMTTLPPGSQLATLVSEQESLLFGQATAYQIVVEYHLLGQVFRRSTLVANVGDTQLRFRFSAPKASFDALDKAFYRSVLAWDFPPAKSAPASPATASK